MVSILTLIAVLALVIQAFIGLTFFISSIWEKEKRATVFAGLQFLGMFSLLILFFFLMRIDFFNTPIGFMLLIGGLVLGTIAFLGLVLRIGANPQAKQGTQGLIVGEVKRYDEREHVFARNRALRPNSEQYNLFYKEHPEYEQFDAKRREKGGPIGHPGTIDRPHDGPNVAATLAPLATCFYLSTPDKVKPKKDPKFKRDKISLSPEEATKRIKGYTRYLGADLVGITEINPLWIYSHQGEIFHENWEDWGREIELNHKYAVVFALEMSFDMVGPAPHTPTTIESMRNYAEGAVIATQLASFIANLGYPATAHHLRHYEAMLVPLAVDAGLGELGRLGYLMTKEFGPRVRLGAVTTDIPLICDKPVDIGIEDFCIVCKKCAVCCPSNSIPLEVQTEVNGTRRWKLNAETCFAYWGNIGTDCNICMQVCPWSHDRTFPHELITALITRNMFARRIFSVMDDIFYGSRPAPKAAPKWAQFNQE